MVHHFLMYFVMIIDSYLIHGAVVAVSFTIRRTDRLHHVNTRGNTRARGLAPVVHVTRGLFITRD